MLGQIFSQFIGKCQPGESFVNRMEQRGANGIDIVMKAGTPNSLILKARKELFITEDVIKALDAKLPKVTIPAVAQ